MIGLDTNVVVRFLTHDDPRQTAAAQKILNSLSLESPGFLSLTVIAEIVWVLTISYGFTKKEIEVALEGLLRSKELIIERTEIVSQALGKFRDGPAGFADCLIERCGHAAGCEHTLTFDKKAAAGAGMRLLA
jgi:predicted nucleic-acid-binding protein